MSDDEFKDLIVVKKRGNSSKSWSLGYERRFRKLIIEKPLVSTRNSAKIRSNNLFQRFLYFRLRELNQEWGLNFLLQDRKGRLRERNFMEKNFLQRIDSLSYLAKKYI